jgi:hypothetical protein
MTEELKPVAAEIGFDREEPNTKAIVIFIAGMVLTFVLVVVGVEQYYSYVHERQEYVNVEARPSEQLRELHAREDWQLTHYGYLDNNKTQVRLPIDRAMELLVKEAAEGKYFYSTAPAPVKNTTASPAPKQGS